MLKLKNRTIGVLFIVVTILLSSVVYAADIPVYKFGIDAAFPPWTWAEKRDQGLRAAKASLGERITNRFISLRRTFMFHPEE